MEKATGFNDPMWSVPPGMTVTVNVSADSSLLVAEPALTDYVVSLMLPGGGPGATTGR